MDEHPGAAWRATPPGPAAAAIGQHVARLVPDGATVQVGLGALADSVLASLAHKRDLGIHSGVIGDGVMKLVQAGVVTNRHTPVSRGISVTGGLLGSTDFYRWAHRNPSLHLRSSRHTHDAGVLAAIPNLHGINSALEVDLTGQINAEVAGRRHAGLVGGHADFTRGCLASPGGQSIIVMESARAAAAFPASCRHWPAAWSRPHAAMRMSWSPSTASPTCAAARCGSGRRR